MRYTHQLQQQMQRAGLTSLKALCQAAGVSKGTVVRLRQGNIARMHLDTAIRLSRALKLPLSALITQFSPQEPPLPPQELSPPRPPEMPAAALTPAVPKAPPEPTDPNPAVLEQLQRDGLQVLEPWLLQWPTAVHAVQVNEALPAVRLLPLVAPVTRLTEAWGVTAIGQVGQQVAYDPQLHQPMSGPIQPGALVRIRYVGYWHHSRLLHRAKTSPI